MTNYKITIAVLMIATILAAGDGKAKWKGTGEAKGKVALKVKVLVPAVKRNPVLVKALLAKAAESSAETVVSSSSAVADGET